ncbi:MAG: hypothetical protein Q9M28_07740 [Mariprofundaceae bacterium]|nr:hypothetical protein [Mariprofundaceae bacterium]
MKFKQINASSSLSKCQHSLALSLGFFETQSSHSIKAGEIKAGDITGGSAMAHVNIAAFHKVHGQESFQYPATIKGAHGALLTALEGKAQFIFLNHTSGLKIKMSSWSAMMSYVKMQENFKILVSMVS